MGGGYHLDLKRDYADYDNDERHIKAIKHSLTLGQNHLDTAYSYGAGHTEEIIGKAIKGYNRKSIFIADKLPKSHMAYSAVIPAIKEMMRRLDVDYIDMVYVHDVNVPEPMEGYIKGLNEAIDSGLINEIGISNANLEQTKEAIKLSKHPISANQIYMNILNRGKSPEELVNYCNNNNIKVVAYFPLQNKTFFDGLKHPLLTEVANKYQRSVSQIALNWLVKHKHVIAIPKASNLKHIDENFSSLDFELSRDDYILLDTLA
jgi:diketogulonate reductase-like aldo/keto reductase